MSPLVLFGSQPLLVSPVSEDPPPFSPPLTILLSSGALFPFSRRGLPSKPSTQTGCHLVLGLHPRGSVFFLSGPKNSKPFRRRKRHQEATPEAGQRGVPAPGLGRGQRLLRPGHRRRCHARAPGPGPRDWERKGRVRLGWVGGLLASQQ